jgi:hypothetical protein
LDWLKNDQRTTNERVPARVENDEGEHVPPPSGDGGGVNGEEPRVPHGGSGSGGVIGGAGARDGAGGGPAMPLGDCGRQPGRGGGHAPALSEAEWWPCTDLGGGHGPLSAPRFRLTDLVITGSVSGSPKW